ncbi:hypothetical protein ACIBCR_16515 [Micromonospora echinospora]|uniref:hypothetical protein n=1 Tax=Micromonospora echinospora TaxID=1877 RepID=UPI0037BCA6D2
MTAAVSDVELAALIASLRIDDQPAPPPVYPPHVMAEGGPDHYAASNSQALHRAILNADWATVRQIADDPYTAGDDVDTAKGALAAALPAGPPPSTVAEMRDVLGDLDGSRPRSRQTRLGPSELGTPCQRQIAMKLAGIVRQPEDKRPPWAPMQGTAMHGLMEEALRFHNAQLGRERWLIEEALTIHPGNPGVEPITGHGDAYDQDHGMVVDWKYVGVTALREVKRKTVPNHELVKPDYRVQAHLYGLGHERAGRDVRYVRLVFLARSHDYADSAEWTEPYNPDIAYQAISRYYGTYDLLTALDVASNPTNWEFVPAAPGKACSWCPFRRVGGPADATGCPGDTDQKITTQLRGLIA